MVTGLLFSVTNSFDQWKGTVTVSRKLPVSYQRRCWRRLISRIDGRKFSSRRMLWAM